MRQLFGGMFRKKYFVIHDVRAIKKTIEMTGASHEVSKKFRFIVESSEHFRQDRAKYTVFAGSLAAKDRVFRKSSQ